MMLLLKAIRVRIPLLIVSLLLSLIAVTSAANQDQDQVKLYKQLLDERLESCIKSGYIGRTDVLCSKRPITVFIPKDYQNHIFSNNTNNRDYHFVHRRLSFSDLAILPIKTRIPTLLTGSSLRVTNNSRSNFTINGIRITQPDLFHDYHGISANGISSTVTAPFDYSLYRKIYVTLVRVLYPLVWGVYRVVLCVLFLVMILVIFVVFVLCFELYFQICTLITLAKFNFELFDSFSSNFPNVFLLLCLLLVVEAINRQVRPTWSG